MKTTYLITTAVIGLALAAPLAAHHNAPFELDIGDMMGRHEAAIDSLVLDMPGSAMGTMDPSNMPDDLDPQPNGTGIPDDFNPGTDNGGNTAGEPRPN